MESAKRRRVDDADPVRAGQAVASWRAADVWTVIVELVTVRDYVRLRCVDRTFRRLLAPQGGLKRRVHLFFDCGHHRWLDRPERLARVLGDTTQAARRVTLHQSLGAAQWGNGPDEGARLFHDDLVWAQFAPLIRGVRHLQIDSCGRVGTWLWRALFAGLPHLEVLRMRSAVGFGEDVWNALTDIKPAALRELRCPRISVWDRGQGPGPLRRLADSGAGKQLTRLQCEFVWGCGTVEDVRCLCRAFPSLTWLGGSDDDQPRAVSGGLPIDDGALVLLGQTYGSRLTTLNVRLFVSTYDPRVDGSGSSTSRIRHETATWLSQMSSFVQSCPNVRRLSLCLPRREPPPPSASSSWPEDADRRHQRETADAIVKLVLDQLQHLECLDLASDGEWPVAELLQRAARSPCARHLRQLYCIAPNYMGGQQQLLRPHDWGPSLSAFGSLEMCPGDVRVHGVTQDVIDTQLSWLGHLKVLSLVHPTESPPLASPIRLDLAQWSRLRELSVDGQYVRDEASFIQWFDRGPLLALRCLITAPPEQQPNDSNDSVVKYTAAVLDAIASRCPRLHLLSLRHTNQWNLARADVSRFLAACEHVSVLRLGVLPQPLSRWLADQRCVGWPGRDVQLCCAI